MSVNSVYDFLAGDNEEIERVHKEIFLHDE